MKINKKLDSIENSLFRAQYRIYKNSAVKICTWTKKSIKNEGYCYKQKFYGTPSHKCMEMTPFIFCQENCIHCWRPKEILLTNAKLIEELTKQVAKPEEIIEKLIEERKKLLIGFKGNKKINKKKLKECFIPVHFAISLIGDPLIYPYLAEMIKILKTKYKAKSIFVVTNCQQPKELEKLIKKDQLPTQLYLSITATNKKDYIKLKRPIYKDAWNRFIKFLKIAKKAKCRKVIRYTLIKEINDKEKNMKELLKLVKLTNPDFLEIKSYMFLGYSTLRLKKENMPNFEDVKNFSLKLLKYLKNFKYENDDEASRIVLLKNKNSKYSTIIESYRK